MSAAALSNELPGGFDPKVLYFTYRHGLKSAGFLSPSGQLRASVLQSQLHAHVARLPNSIRICRPELHRETEILIAILRSRTETFNTLPHLVLIDFLFESWAHFVSTYEWEGAMDFTYAVASVKQVPNAQPGPSKVRASTAAKHDQCVRVIEQYLREHTTALRTQLRTACGGAWRWLYRYDRTWLDANAPAPVPRGRRYVSWVDWERRDATLVDLIDGKQCSESLAPAARITPRTVLRTMGRLPFSVQLNRMPKSMAKLTEIAEQIKRERKWFP